MKLEFMICLGALVLATGCQESGMEASLPEDWPLSEDPILAQGRGVWLENCKNCHAIGKAQSPRFGDAEAWGPRLAKGESVLIKNAIQGYEGKSEGGMPPRGGNEDLSDTDVAAAVKYMIQFSTSP